MTESSDIAPVTDSQSRDTASRRTRYRMLAVGGLAAVVIAGGGAAALAVGSSPSGTPSSSPTPPGYGGYGPAHGGPGYGMGPGGPRGTAPSATRSPHLEGTVVSSGGSMIVITDRDGFQRTIKVSSATKYADSVTATVAKGTVIHAEGTVDANKTTLDATSIGKGNMHGPGRPGGAGFGPRPGPGTSKPSA